MTDVQVGELGISYNIVGSVAQALGQAAIDRGEVTKEQVVTYLSSGDYDEDELWEVLGPLIDKIEIAAINDTCLREGCGHLYLDHVGGEDCRECGCTWFDTIGSWVSA